MDVKAPRRFTNKRERSFFNSLGQLGGGGGSRPSKKVICVYHLEGRCNRNPCRFLHVESPAPHVNGKIAKQLPEGMPNKSPNYNRPKNVWVSSGSEDRNQDRVKRDHNYTAPKKLASATGNDESGNITITQKTAENVCDHWISGNCVRGDECKFLHSWYRGDGFSMLAKLDGHKKVCCIRDVLSPCLFCSLFVLKYLPLPCVLTRYGVFFLFVSYLPCQTFSDDYNGTNFV